MILGVGVEAIGALLEEIADERGWQYASTASTDTAKEFLEEEGRRIDFIVVGSGIDSDEAFDFYDAVLEQYPDVPAIIFRSDLDEEEIEREDAVMLYEEENRELAVSNLADTMQAAIQVEPDTSYPEPEDEDERLAVLDRFDFDSLEQAPFYNRLTQLGAAFFDVPMCYIGIVEEETERFIACHGVDFDPIEREETICTFAIIRDDVLVVDDVQNDPRFKDKESLQELGIEWYASAPITVDGHRIGTFCLADREKREFSEEEREHLRMFGEEFAEQLQHHLKS